MSDAGETWISANAAREAAFKANPTVSPAASLLKWASLGVIRSRASDHEEYRDDARLGPVELTPFFWQSALEVPAFKKLADWQIGYFVGALELKDGNVPEVRAIGVEFSADDLANKAGIDVRPPTRPKAAGNGGQLERRPVSVATPIGQDATNQGAPSTVPERARVGDGTLKKWWDNLASRVDPAQLSLEELWALAEAAHPDNRVVRTQIQALAGPRKKGPKPISPENAGR